MFLPLKISLEFCVQCDHAAHKPGTAGVILTIKEHGARCRGAISISFPAKAYTSYKCKIALSSLHSTYSGPRLAQMMKKAAQELQKNMKTASGTPLNTQRITHWREFMD